MRSADSPAPPAAGRAVIRLHPRSRRLPWPSGGSAGPGVVGVVGIGVGDIADAPGHQGSAAAAASRSPARKTGHGFGQFGVALAPAEATTIRATAARPGCSWNSYGPENSGSRSALGGTAQVRYGRRSSPPTRRRGPRDGSRASKRRQHRLGQEPGSSLCPHCPRGKTAAPQAGCQPLPLAKASGVGREPDAKERPGAGPGQARHRERKAKALGRHAAGSCAGGCQVQGG